MASSSRIQLEQYLKTLEVKGRVCDIGGSVQSLKGRVKTFNPTEYLIMDNGSEKGLHEKWTEPDIEWDICEYIDFQDGCCDAEFHKDGKYGDYFDQVFMIEVSEYLTDPIQALENVYSLLKDGGEFVISYHTVYSEHPPEGKDIFRYTPGGMELLLKNAGFEIVEHQLRTATSDYLTLFYNAEGCRGKNHNNTTGGIVRARK